MTYLITRPQPEAERVKRALDALRLDNHLCPLMTLETKPFDLPPMNEIAGFIITSTNALRGLAELKSHAILSKPIFCVGRYSAASARKFGFNTIHFGEGDAADMMKLVKKFPSDKPYMFLTGEDRKPTVETMCAEAGQPLLTLETYTMTPRKQLSNYTVACFRSGQITHGMVYSERTAKILLELLKLHGIERQAKATLWHCLSANIAQVLIDQGFRADYPLEPTHEALMDLARADRADQAA